MLAQFDIFRIDDQDVLLWCAAAETLEQAEARARTLSEADHREYVIFSQRSGARITIKCSCADTDKN